jgi:CheY-like chemotaxis protein
MAVVLIVEDDVAMRGLTELSLNEFGYETLIAGDVESALEILRSPARIDVLFTDIYLKEHVHGGCEVAIEGAGCIGKPYAIEQVHAALQDLLLPVAA